MKTSEEYAEEFLDYANQSISPLADCKARDSIHLMEVLATTINRAIFEDRQQRNQISYLKTPVDSNYSLDYRVGEAETILGIYAVILNDWEENK